MIDAPNFVNAGRVADTTALRHKAAPHEVHLAQSQRSETVKTGVESSFASALADGGGAQLAGGGARAVAMVFGVVSRGFYAILTAMHESRRRQAEREIEKFVRKNGQQMSDDLERRINSHLFASDWSRANE